MNTAPQLNPGSRKRKGERGASLILFTFMTFLVVVPMIGLAIDGAVVFWEKARLSAAVDAAALSAGRNLSLGVDTATAQAGASSTASSYFAANFPSGVMGTSISLLNIQVPPPTGGLWTITVDATATVPLYFTRLFGRTTATLNAHGQANRRNVNVVVVLDRSYSLALSNSCSSLISSAQSFTNMFVGGQDELGLITFQTTSNIDFAPGTDFKTRTPTSMTSTIGQLACTGYTNTVMALNQAYGLIKNTINQPGALNVIVFFSDGKPDAITANFSMKGADTRYGNYPYTSGTSAASTCTSDPGRGVLVALDENPDTTGPTVGLFQDIGMPINSYASDSYGGLLPTSYVLPAAADPNCSFSNPTPAPTVSYGGPSGLYCSNEECNVRQDVAFIPGTDAYNNSTNTTFRPITVANNGLFPSGDTYANQIRPDTPAGVVNAALNAAYAQALQIRADSTYNIMVYSIGLGNYVDTDFMREIANDPNATYHDSTRPSGFYVYAPSAGQLQSAFQTIASQVLRLSQ